MSLDKGILWSLVHILLSTAFTAIDANIFPASSLSINSGEGFVFRLNFGPSSDNRQCRLVYDGMDEVLHLPTDSVLSQVTNNYETVESLGSGECGARVHNVSSLSTTFWGLEAESSDESIYGTLRLNILSSVPETPVNYESAGVAGHFGTIHCPGDHNEQRYCEITDPQGKSTEACELQVKFPALTNEAAEVFTCRVFFWGRVDAVISEIQVRSHESPAKVVSSLTETENHVLLSCALKESLAVCRAESLTTNNQFLIMDGFQSRRYSTRNTLLESGLCQFEIPKPIAANETGVWRIHGRLKSSGDWAGCLFHLNVDLSVVYEEFRSGLEENSSVEIMTTTSEAIEIRCADAPYELDYCYLVTPAKEVIRPTAREMILFKAYGRCTFAKVPSATGRYTCGFNSLDHSEDLLQHFDVRYNDPSVFVAVQREVVTVDDPTTNGIALMCFALQGYSIDSCSFVAPSGDLYHLPNSSYSHNRFAYLGRGFEEGECGIELKRVEEGMIGNWTCSVSLVARIARYDVHIMVKAQAEDVVSDSNSKRDAKEREREFLFINCII